MGNLPLYLIERAVVTALESMEVAEVNLAYYATDLPTAPLEQVALDVRITALTEELRVVRDAMAQLTGRVEQAGRAGGRAGGRVVDAHEVPPPTGCCGEEPSVSRRALVKLMMPWPGITAWAYHEAQNRGERGTGYSAVQLRAYGFGPARGTHDRPD
jgi:hypothetical protein